MIIIYLYRINRFRDVIIIIIRLSKQFIIKSIVEISIKSIIE